MRVVREEALDSTVHRECLGMVKIAVLAVLGGWLILGWISRRWDVGMWTGLDWPRIETGGGRL